MIIKIVTGLVGWVIKKILIISLVIGLAVWFFIYRGPDRDFDFSSVYNYVQNLWGGVQVEVDQNGKNNFELTEEQKKQIDAWIEANDLNQYGDPQGTVYLGGTPLFDERTGERIDRYNYILSSHPELQELLK